MCRLMAHRSFGNLVRCYIEAIMQCAKHIQVQHKTNMINEEWKKSDAHFVAFSDTHAVTFVLSGEIADVFIPGRQWFILTPQLTRTGLTNPFYIETKI